ncbi:interleukin-9 [Megaptera novaeangliae]
MLLAVVLASALLLCSAASQRCLILTGIKDVEYLINNLQDNCTTACLQEGLSQMTNTTVKTSFPLIFNRVKKTVEALQNNKCGSFSCEKPCNQTTAGNMMTFLKTLLESFQKERMRGRV